MLVTPSRNQPCPCGSGKKYKKCCGVNTGNVSKNKSVPHQPRKPKRVIDTKAFVQDRLEKLITETKSIRPNDHVIKQLTYQLHELKHKGNLTHNEYRLIKEVAFMNVLEYGQLPYGDTPDYGAMRVFFEFAHQAITERITDEHQYYSATVYVGPDDTVVKWEFSTMRGWGGFRENDMNISWEDTSEPPEKTIQLVEEIDDFSPRRHSPYKYDIGIEEFIAAYLDLISIEIEENPRVWLVIDLIGDIKPFSSINDPVKLENLKEMYLTEVEITLSVRNENAVQRNISWSNATQSVKDPYDTSLFTKLQIVNYILEEIKKYIKKDQDAASKETILLYLTFVKNVLVNNYPINELVLKPLIVIFIDGNQEIVDFTITQSDVSTRIAISKAQKQSAPNHYATPFMPGELVFVSPVDTTKQSNDYVHLLDIGISYKRRGLYKQAKDQYIKAINVNPKHFQAYYNLGKVLYILGDYRQAVKSYKTALELGYDRIGDVMRHLGHALLDQYVSESEKHIVMSYLQSVDPFKMLTHKKPTKKEMDEYDAKCAAAARQYIESVLADE